MAEFKYRPDIDGIRTVAVTLVILYHSGFGFTGGFLGVDVFFVISGYLITGLIRKQQEAGDFSLSAFWLRRIRRILPASTVVVMTTLLLGGLLLLPSDLNDLAKSTVWQQIMSSNVYFWRHSDYFDSPAETKPLLHTWSLAVEEQFYLFYPLILVLGRRLTKSGICSLLSSLAVISFALSEWGVRSHPSATFYLLPFRAWELLLGGLLCFAPPPNRLPHWISNLISWSSLATILGTAWMYDSTTPFPGSAALVPCLATACLIYSNSRQLTLPGRLLATKPMVFTGLLSYSLYLWHWPVLAFSRYWLGSLLPFYYRLTLLGVMYGLAYASWRLIEVPFRKPSLQSPTSIKAPFIAAPVSAALIIALSFCLVLTKGAEFRFSAKVLALDKRANDRVNPEFETSIEAARIGNIPTIGINAAVADRIDFIIWGDSHARAIGRLCDNLAKEHGLRGAIASRTGTLPLLGTQRLEKDKYDAEWNNAVLSFVKAHHIRQVLLVSRWSHHAGRAVLLDKPLETNAETHHRECC